MAFPTSPANGEYFHYQGSYWQYTSGRWKRIRGNQNITYHGHNQTSASAVTNFRYTPPHPIRMEFGALFTIKVVFRNPVNLGGRFARWEVDYHDLNNSKVKEEEITAMQGEGRLVGSNPTLHYNIILPPYNGWIKYFQVSLLYSYNQRQAGNWVGFDILSSITSNIK